MCMVERLLIACHKLMLTRELGIQKWFQKNHAVFLDEGLYLKRHGFDSLFWRTVFAGSISCPTWGEQTELELGWLSAWPYASGLRQIACSWKWLTDPGSTALRGKSIQCFKTCKCVKRLPGAIGVAAGQRRQSMEWKTTSKCVFIFRNPAMFLMFSFSVPFIYLEPCTASGR